MKRLSMPSGRSVAAALLCSTSALCAGSAAIAEIVRLDVIETVPAFGGKSFGEVGAYELIKARAHGEVDPADPQNAVIADIELAPRNERGMVEYSTEVEILRPADPLRGNDRLFFEVLNRGNKGIVSRFNDAPGGNDMSAPDAAGDGFLFERGYTLAWAGWQNNKNVEEGEGRMMAEVPEARSETGEPITGEVIMERIFNNDEDTEIPLLFSVADMEAEDARVLVRNSSAGDRVALPADAWSFVDERTVEIDRSHQALADYDAGAAYEVIYTARDPDVSGLGFAMTRDVVAFLKHDRSEQNPLRETIHYALAHGNSQSGRMLKGFLYDGFNEDESGRVVFEGVNVNISGAHAIALNERFGDANATGRAYERHANAKIEFPFTYDVREDPLTGQSDGIFANCRESETCPKVFHTDSANEAWGKAASLVTTDGMGRDIELPEDVRVYYFASTQHGADDEPERTYCQQLTNPNPWEPHLRALFVALDGWATAGMEPPASTYPRVSDGTLAPPMPQNVLGFPEIPGVTYNGTINRIGVPDKSELPYSYLEGQEYVVLAPRTDADGNDLAGIRSLDVAVPRATYTGWALRRAGFAENEECQLNGQYIPFAGTREERMSTGDPRPSIEERYSNGGAYVRAVAAAAEQLVDARYLLPQDAEAAIGEAAERAVSGLTN